MDGAHSVLHMALQQLNVEPFVLVAHSWATLAALELALLVPEQIRRLVLLSGYYFPTLRLDVSRRPAGTVRCRRCDALHDFCARGPGNIELDDKGDVCSSNRAPTIPACPRSRNAPAAVSTEGERRRCCLHDSFCCRPPPSVSDRRGA